MQLFQFFFSSSLCWITRWRFPSTSRTAAPPSWGLKVEAFRLWSWTPLTLTVRWRCVLSGGGRFLDRWEHLWEKHDLLHRLHRRISSGLQLLFLSEDSVSLGDIPVLSPSSRIFFLTNVSNTDSVVYSWQLPLQSGLQVCHHSSVLKLRLVVKPALSDETDPSRTGSGRSRRMWPVRPHLHSFWLPRRLSAGPGLSGTGILVSYSSAAQQPVSQSCWSLCLLQVTPEAALTRYLKALDLWEQEKQRQLDGFTISDPNVSERRILLIEKVRLHRQLF